MQNFSTSFLDAETAGGDELRAMPASVLARMLADALAAAEAERDTFPLRSGRQLRASMRLVDRAEAVACRLHEYIGYKVAELDAHAPLGCSHK